MKTKRGTTALAIGALGVVFGDIGTSPLYALRAVFGIEGHRLEASAANIYGIVSVILWAVTLVVSIKYLGFVMRANNEGEGGIMALVSLIKTSRLRKHRKWFFILMGLIGASLFYGDSAITPAISVLSAVEGLGVIAPHINVYIVPFTLVILTLLFWLQRYGTGTIGRLFGPIMLLWFATIGAGGLWRIMQHPDMLRAISPLTALSFITSRPLVAFIAMSAVVLVITGAEALYADMGHFGRPPIAKAWFFVVFPALALCYMGEGALILHHPSLTGNILVQLFPTPLQLPIILLATLATLIASQSVIAGAFSLTRQAIQLGFLPRMLIRYTSIRENGQIYVPFVNLLLFIVVTLLVLFFTTSERLAGAYGIAVSGALAIDTILFIVVLRSLWRKSRGLVLIAGVVFLPIDLVFVSSNIPKILRGGWVPIIIALFIYFVIDTWMKGQQIVAQERKTIEGPLQDLVNHLHSLHPPLKRVPSQVVFIGHHANFAPLALHATIDELHELPEKISIVSVETTTAAHVPADKRATINELGHNDGISQVILSYGFHDHIDVPKTLESLRGYSPELNFDLDKVAYIVSRTKVVPTKRHNLTNWRKSLYCSMVRNALSTSDYLKLPLEHTEEMYSPIKL